MRISITQNCDLACFYCHHEGEFEPGREMTALELERIARLAVELGVREVKLTGGEPLVRKDVVDVVKAIATHLQNSSLTTNGIALPGLAQELKEAGLKRVNVSLDTLHRERYRAITGCDALTKVIDGIRAAAVHGLNPVKVNMVVMRENVDEVGDMLAFCQKEGVVLQLIELEVPRDQENDGYYAQQHVDLGPLEREMTLIAVSSKRRRMHGRTKYFLPQEVEVVRPMHNTQFCASCTRLRLMSDGFLRPCLLSREGTVDLLSPLRQGADDEELKRLFNRAVSLRRPYWN